jgi:hypothetical protein
MGAAEALVALAAIGCGTGTVIVFMRTLFGGGRRAADQELAATRARLAQLELDNEHLRKQVEWHARLLQEDRLVAQLAPAPEDGVATGSSRRAPTSPSSRASAPADPVSAEAREVSAHSAKTLTSSAARGPSPYQ